jgi:hypothetical protein
MDAVQPDQPDAITPSSLAAALREPVHEIGQGSDIVSRPIFHASRRPWVAPPSAGSPVTGAQPASVAPPPAPPAQWTLTGTITQDGAPAAILRSASITTALVVHEGDLVDGWTVQAIRHDRLIFERSGQTWDLGFRKAP